MKIYNSVSELVGRTPLLRLGRLSKEYGAAGEVLAKLEYFNPAGSVKDRVGRELILAGLEQGTIKPDSILVEPTSGNTGIGLAAIGASLGLRVILVMPESMSIERRKLLLGYGAEIVLTPAGEGMAGAVRKAEEMCRKDSRCLIPGQFANPLNPLAHYKTTGPEIWEDTEGSVDVFVATVGTGGTLTGTARYLKEKKPGLLAVAGEPESSPLLSKGVAGPHKIQGIGANFVPEVLDRSLIDEIIAIPNEKAFELAKALARLEGVLAGISSGAALYAAFEVAKRKEMAGKRLVVILPDTGERYLSTELFPTV